MLLSIAYFALGRLLRALAPSARGDLARDVELFVLRHQVKVLSRGVRRPPFRRRDRMLLAAASRILPRKRWTAFVVSPEPCSGGIGSWSVASGPTGGAGGPAGPGLDQRTVELIVRMARDNARWGYLRIRGELLKLGIRVSATSIRAVLRRHGLGPAPRRSGPTWREFLAQQASGILACDFFTVETVWLTTLYVLFFIQLSTRRVYLGGVSAHPDSAWVTQQARNLAIDGRLENARFLIRDRDAKYSGSFDEVLRTEGVSILRTPIRSPRANAFAERWVRTARRECLDHLLIFGRRHLERVLREFVGHYNAERPHRGLQLARPSPSSFTRSPGTGGAVRRRDRLGGLIHEYCEEAA